MTCVHCSTGPSGIAGHPQLLAHSLGTQIVFKCRACDTLWLRTGRGEGDYTWSNLAGAATFGVLVPRRLVSPDMGEPLVPQPSESEPAA